MIGSANELHLDAFREHPEFASFRGRLELDSRAVPAQLRAGAGHLRHARRAAGPPARRAPRDRDGGDVRRPHAHAQAQPRPLSRARSARRLDAHRGREGGPLRERARRPSASTPTRRSCCARPSQRALRGERLVPDLRGAHRREPARDARRAARRGAVARRSSASRPLAVLDEIEALCQRKNEFEWLQQDAIAGGYHDVKEFRERARARLLDELGVRALRRERPRAGGAVRRALRAVRAARERVGEEGAPLQPRHAASTRSPTRR